MSMTRSSLRLLSHATRWLWRAVVVLVIVVAVTVTAGRELAPLLDRHRHWFEAQLSQAFGEPVTMQSVRAYWKGLAPELAAGQLAVGHFGRVERLLLRLDLLESARARAPVFDTLDLQGAEVRIPLGAAPSEADFNLRAGLEFLFSSSDIHIRDLRIALVPDNGKPLLLHVDEVTVDNRAQHHQLKAVIAIADDHAVPAAAVQPVTLVLSFDGDADNLFAGAGRAHLSLGDRRNVPELADFLGTLFAGHLAGFALEGSGNLSGQVWADWKDGHIDWVSDTALADLHVSVAPPGTAPTAGADPARHYRIDYTGRLAGQVWMRDLHPLRYLAQVPEGQSVSINDKATALPQLAWQYDTGLIEAGVAGADQAGHMSFLLPTLDLAETARYLDLVPSESLRALIDTLKPSGSLDRIRIDWPLAADGPPLRLRANLRQVSVAAWEGAPALERVDGYVEATPDGGVVELDAGPGFSMHYPLVFAEAQAYQRAQGRVYWKLDPNDGHVYVAGRQLHLQGEEGELHGEFWLDLPPHGSGEESDLYLAVGLANADVKYRNRYLPTTLDASLRQWLDDSIGAGTLTASGFIYRGALHDGDPFDHTLLYFGDVRDAKLRFDPAWPALEHLDAQVLVDNDEVHGSVQRARFLGFGLADGTAVLAAPRADAAAQFPGHFLTVEAAAEGAGSALDIVHSTPLQQTLGKVFDGWQLGGPTQGHLQLGFGIGRSVHRDFQEIDLHLAGNDVYVGPVRLPLAQVVGDVHYSSANGLSSTPLSAQLWGRPQQIALSPLPNGEHLPDVAVAVSGALDPAPLAAWAQLPLLHFLGAALPYEGRIVLPVDNAGDPARPDADIALTSNLAAVPIALPPPLDKAANDTVPLELHATIQGGHQRYHIRYGQRAEGAPLVEARIEESADGALRGQVLLGEGRLDDNASLPDHLQVNATLDAANLADWADVINRHADFVKADQASRAANGAATAGNAVSSMPSFALHLARPAIGSTLLDPLDASVAYRREAPDAGWEASFENSRMKGRYRYFDEAGRLPELELDTIRLGDPDPEPSAATPAAPEDDSQRVDPLADVEPQKLPALRVHAKQVILKGDEVGDWRYTVQPDAAGATLAGLVVTMPGLSITGAGQETGATLRWTRDASGAMHTEAVTHLHLSNQDGARKLFGMERIVEAEKTEIDGTVDWNGSPAMISFRRLHGTLAMSSEKGRFLNSTASTDLMRVINVFNFSAWARRLKLDFTDLYKKGVSYDEVKGRVNLDAGKLTFEEPMRMDGPSGRFELAGSIDSVANTIDGTLNVTIPVSQNAGWIAVLAANLPVAAGVWAISKIFGDQIDRLSSLHYTVTGTLDDPKVKFENLLPELSKDRENPKKDAGKDAQNDGEKPAGKREGAAPNAPLPGAEE